MPLWWPRDEVVGDLIDQAKKKYEALTSNVSQIATQPLLLERARSLFDETAGGIIQQAGAGLQDLDMEDKLQRARSLFDDATRGLTDLGEARDEFVQQPVPAGLLRPQLEQAGQGLQDFGSRAATGLAAQNPLTDIGGEVSRAYEYGQTGARPEEPPRNTSPAGLFADAMGGTGMGLFATNAPAGLARAAGEFGRGASEFGAGIQDIQAGDTGAGAGRVGLGALQAVGAPLNTLGNIATEMGRDTGMSDPTAELLGAVTNFAAPGGALGPLGRASRAGPLMRTAARGLTGAGALVGAGLGSGEAEGLGQEGLDKLATVARRSVEGANIGANLPEMGQALARGAGGLARGAGGLAGRLYQAPGQQMGVVNRPAVDFDPEAVRRANATSRTTGKFGEAALVPKYVRDTFTPEQAGAVLDFGAGDPPTWTTILRSMGYDVTAYEFGANAKPGLHDPEALSRQYDTVYASRVLNVQETPKMLHDTLSQIAAATKPEGRVIFNYPEEPRRWVKADGTKATPAEMLERIKEHFQVVDRVGGSAGRPIWEAALPMTRQAPTEGARAPLGEQLRKMWRPIKPEDLAADNAMHPGGWILPDGSLLTRPAWGGTLGSGRFESHSQSVARAREAMGEENVRPFGIDNISRALDEGIVQVSMVNPQSKAPGVSNYMVAAHSRPLTEAQRAALTRLSREYKKWHPNADVEVHLDAAGQGAGTAAAPGAEAHGLTAQGVGEPSLENTLTSVFGPRSTGAMAQAERIAGPAGFAAGAVTGPEDQSIQDRLKRGLVVGLAGSRALRSAADIAAFVRSDGQAILSRLERLGIAGDENPDLFDNNLAGRLARLQEGMEQRLGEHSALSRRSEQLQEEIAALAEMAKQKIEKPPNRGVWAMGGRHGLTQGDLHEIARRSELNPYEPGWYQNVDDETIRLYKQEVMAQRGRTPPETPEKQLQRMRGELRQVNKDAKDLEQRLMQDMESGQRLEEAMANKGIAPAPETPRGTPEEVAAEAQRLPRAGEELLPPTERAPGPPPGTPEAVAAERTRLPRAPSPLVVPRAPGTVRVRRGPQRGLGEGNLPRGTHAQGAIIDPATGRPVAPERQATAFPENAPPTRTPEDVEADLRQAEQDLQDAIDAGAPPELVAAAREEIRQRRIEQLNVTGAPITQSGRTEIEPRTEIGRVYPENAVPQEPLPGTRIKAYPQRPPGTPGDLTTMVPEAGELVTVEPQRVDAGELVLGDIPPARVETPGTRVRTKDTGQLGEVVAATRSDPSRPVDQIEVRMDDGTTETLHPDLLRPEDEGIPILHGTAPSGTGQMPLAGAPKVAAGAVFPGRVSQEPAPLPTVPRGPEEATPPTSQLEELRANQAVQEARAQAAADLKSYRNAGGVLPDPGQAPYAQASRNAPRTPLNPQQQALWDDYQAARARVQDALDIARGSAAIGAGPPGPPRPPGGVPRAAGEPEQPTGGQQVQAVLDGLDDQLEGMTPGTEEAVTGWQKLGKALSQARYINLLAGTASAVGDIVGNVILIPRLYNRVLIASAVEAAKGVPVEQRATTMSQITGINRGVREGGLQAIKEAWDVFMYGYSRSQEKARRGGAANPDVGDEYFRGRGWLPIALGYRIRLAADALTVNSGERIGSYAMGYREADRAKLVPGTAAHTAYAENVARHVQGEMERIRQTLKPGDRVPQGGVTPRRSPAPSYAEVGEFGTTTEPRGPSRGVSGPYGDVLDYNSLAKEAFTISRDLAYQRALGASSEAIAEVRMKIPLMRTVMAFYRASNRVAQDMIQMDPVLGTIGTTQDAIKAAFGHGPWAAVKGDPPSSIWARSRDAHSLPLSQRLADQALGVMIASAGAALAANGVITGPGPSDASVKRKMMNEGWRPGAYAVPDGEGGIKGYIPLTRLLGAFAMPLITGASLYEMYERGVNLGDEPQQLLTNFISAQEGMVSSQSGLRDIYELLNVPFTPDPDEAARTIERLAANVVGQHIPVVGLLRQASGAWDEAQRDPRNTVERLLADIPFTRGRVEPRRTETGEVVTRGPGERGLRAFLPLQEVENAPGLRQYEGSRDAAMDAEITRAINAVRNYERDDEQFRAPTTRQQALVDEFAGLASQDFTEARREERRRRRIRGVEESERILGFTVPTSGR